MKQQKETELVRQADIKEIEHKVQGTLNILVVIAVCMFVVGSLVALIGGNGGKNPERPSEIGATTNNKVNTIGTIKTKDGVFFRLDEVKVMKDEDIVQRFVTKDIPKEKHIIRIDYTVENKGVREIVAGMNERLFYDSGEKVEPAPYIDDFTGTTILEPGNYTKNSAYYVVNKSTKEVDIEFDVVYRFYEREGEPLKFKAAFDDNISESK